MVSPNTLIKYVNRYLKTYDSTYSTDNIRHIVASKKVFSYMPFNKFGGIIMDPNLKFAIFYTDTDDITQWQEEHADYLHGEWHNDQKYDHVSFAGGGSGLRKRGRPSVEEAALIKQHQWEMTQHVIEQMAAGKSGKIIAHELGITPSRVSQLKKRYESDYFVDMMDIV